MIEITIIINYQLWRFYIVLQFYLSYFFKRKQSIICAKWVTYALVKVRIAQIQTHVREAALIQLCFLKLNGARALANYLHVRMIQCVKHLIAVKPLKGKIQVIVSWYHLFAIQHFLTQIWQQDRHVLMTFNAILLFVKIWNANVKKMASDNVPMINAAWTITVRHATTSMRPSVQ